MKKCISVICVVLLLCAACILPTSAAVTPAVRMDGPVQAKAGETISVAMYVQGAIGGVEGLIEYDPAKLDYVGTTLRADVVALGNTEDVTVRADEAAGEVHFVDLSNVDGGTAPNDAWLSVNFEVLMTTAGDSTAVTLADVFAADMTSLGTVDVINANTTVTVVDDSNLSIDMEGATIKTDIAKQGIRFQSTKTAVVTPSTSITEAGIIMLPTALLYDGQDLELNTVGKRGATPAVAKTNDADELARIANGESLFGTLTNGTVNGRANVQITARAYVKLSSGAVVYYSHNEKTDTGIETGEATKSLVSLAQSIAKKQIEGGATDTLGEVLTNRVLADDEVTELLTFCRENFAFL